MGSANRNTAILVVVAIVGWAMFTIGSNTQEPPKQPEQLDRDTSIEWIANVMSETEYWGGFFDKINEAIQTENMVKMYSTCVLAEGHLEDGVKLRYPGRWDEYNSLVTGWEIAMMDAVNDCIDFAKSGDLVVLERWTRSMQRQLDLLLQINDVVAANATSLME